MVNEKAKEKIRKILVDSVTPGNFYYSKAIQNPPQLAQLFQAVHNVLEKHKCDISLSFENFQSLFNAFKKDVKKDIDKASGLFMDSVFKNGQLQAVSLPMIRGKKKHKGVKKQRYAQWGFLKIAWDMLNNPDSTNYLDKDIRFLVAFKSHLIEPYRSFVIPSLLSQTEYHPTYILRYFGIRTDQYEKVVEIRNRVDNIGARVDGDIWYLKHMLKMIPWIIKKYPQASIWLRDIFGDSAYYYNFPAPDRKSRNRPRFKYSYELFVQFINGKTYKQLGFTRNAGNKFATQYRPQGALCLLHEIHLLLYGLTEETNKIIHNKTREIKKIFEPLPPFLRKELLNQLNKSIA